MTTLDDVIRQYTVLESQLQFNLNSHSRMGKIPPVLGAVL